MNVEMYVSGSSNKSETKITKPEQKWKSILTKLTMKEEWNSVQMI